MFNSLVLMTSPAINARASENMGYIYILTNKLNGKNYVGQTKVSVRQRFNSHVHTCKHRDDMPISRAINKYGKDNFEILSFDIENCDLDLIESRVISCLDSITNGYNLETGGNKHKQLSEVTKNKIRQSLNGHIVSEETRRKISTANRGRTPTESERKKMSEAQKSRITKEKIEKMRQLGLSRKGKPSWHKGKKRSDETRMKLSITAKNRVSHNWYGKYHSKVSKQKISCAIKNWWMKRKNEEKNMGLCPTTQ